VLHGWNHGPIHLVGSHVDLDRRTPGAVGTAKASPHSGEVTFEGSAIGDSSPPCSPGN